MLELAVRLLADQSRYPSTYQAYPQLMGEEGLSGCFRGVLPSTLRGGFIAVGELATYDHAKHELKAYFYQGEVSTRDRSLASAV